MYVYIYIYEHSSEEARPDRGLCSLDALYVSMCAYYIYIYIYIYIERERETCNIYIYIYTYVYVYTLALPLAAAPRRGGCAGTRWWPRGWPSWPTLCYTKV